MRDLCQTVFAQALYRHVEPTRVPFVKVLPDKPAELAERKTVPAANNPRSRACARCKARCLLNQDLVPLPAPTQRHQLRRYLQERLVRCQLRILHPEEEPCKTRRMFAKQPSRPRYTARCPATSPTPRHRRGSRPHALAPTGGPSCRGTRPAGSVQGPPRPGWPRPAAPRLAHSRLGSAPESTRRKELLASPGPAGASPPK